MSRWVCSCDRTGTTKKRVVEASNKAQPQSTLRMQLVYSRLGLASEGDRLGAIARQRQGHPTLRQAIAPISGLDLRFATESAILFLMRGGVENLRLEEQTA